MNKNDVKFTGYMIKEFNLEKIENIPKEKEKQLSLATEVLTNSLKGKENSFCVSMKLELYTDKSKINLVFNGYFDIPKGIDEEVKTYFLKVSAPSILYPYIRAFISNVTSFDIDETVILPIINFANINKDE